MRLSFLLKTVGGLDLATAALMLGGAALIATSLVAAAALVAPSAVLEPSTAEPAVIAPAPTVANRASLALSADQVATVLFVDASTGAGSAARSGDRVDVLGYFSRQVIGIESITRMLLQDVAVLTVDRSGPTVALTLGVPHDAALLLQEAQAIGARPFVMLRSAQRVPSAEGAPRSFSDANLAERLASVP